jgi:predicted secreted protein
MTMERATVTVSGNGGNRFEMPYDASLNIPYGSAHVTVENNTIGLNLGAKSSLAVVGGLVVRNNGSGIVADAASHLLLIGIPPNATSVENNATADVDLRFGTRTTVDGATIGKLKCDGTVLSRGTTVCP